VLAVAQEQAVGAAQRLHLVAAGPGIHEVVAAREHVVAGTAAQERAWAPRGRAAIGAGAELDRPRQPVGERDGVVAVATVDVGPYAAVRGSCADFAGSARRPRPLSL
jgi:hypothetical protein